LPEGRWQPPAPVFKIAFEHWISDAGQPDLPTLIRESLDELRAVTAGK